MASECTKCGDTEHYNFALNIGLCDPCIGERIEELEADAKIRQSVCDTIEKEVTKINEKLKEELDAECRISQMLLANKKKQNKQIAELKSLLEQLIFIAEKSTTDDSEDATIGLANQALKGE